MSHKFVRIEWEDSSSSGRIWNSEESLKSQKNSRCTSVGYLVHEDKHCVRRAGRSARAAGGMSELVIDSCAAGGGAR